MTWYQNVSEFLVKFKNILTTVIGFIPLVYVVIDTFQTWSLGGSANVLELLSALAIAIVGWFTGKSKMLK